MSPDRVAQLQGVIDLSPIHRELGLRLIELGDELVLEAKLTARYANAADGATAHGGILALILDTAATLALIAQDGNDWTTIDLRIDYLLPLGMGALSARAKVLHLGRSVGRAQASLLDTEQRTCAISTGTFRRGSPLLASDQ